MRIYIEGLESQKLYDNIQQYVEEYARHHSFPFQTTLRVEIYHRSAIAEEKLYAVHTVLHGECTYSHSNSLNSSMLSAIKETLAEIRRDISHTHLEQREMDQRIPSHV